MSDASTFALLVPCKNGARFLPRLFASAQAQTRRFDEVWMFDDGSEDNSGEIAASFGARVLRSPKSLGPSAARNRLMTACQCDWLHFHDADDIMDPRYLECAITRTRSDVDLVICDMLWIEEETGRVDNRWSYDASALARHPSSYLLLNTVGGINGLYRRSSLMKIGGFAEGLNYWEDMELNLRLTQGGAKAEVINEDLVTAFRRQGSYSNSNLGEVWRVKLKIMESLRTAADPVLLTTIAKEAETIAHRFAALRLWRDVRPALDLARLVGGDPPTTESTFLRVLKRMLPAIWTFRLQYALREKRAR